MKTLIIWKSSKNISSVGKVILKLLNTIEIKNCSLNKPYETFGWNGTIKLILFLKVKFCHSFIVTREYLNSPSPPKGKKTTTELIFKIYCTLFVFCFINHIWFLFLLYIDIFYYYKHNFSWLHFIHQLYLPLFT